MEMNEQLSLDMPPGGYSSHEIADAMPEMPDNELNELADDIAEHGQRDDIVLLDGKVLDGRQRQRAALTRGVTPRFRVYEPATDGESPTAFVASHNIKRRQLTSSQRAAAAAELLPYLEKEARARQVVAGAANLQDYKSRSSSERNVALTKKPPDEFDQDNGFNPEDGAQDRKSGHAEGKSAAHAARMTGASARSVEAAKTIKEDDPKTFQEIKAGKKTIGAALKGKPSAGSKAAEQYEKSLARIEKVCGKPQADAIKAGDLMRNRKEVMAYADLSDTKMLAIRSLVDQGWTVKKATHYKAEDIVPTHTLRDAMWRALIAKDRKYSQKVSDENTGLVAMVTIEIVKGEHIRKSKKAAKRKAAKLPIAVIF
jgi:hypothetical protein